jgi:hypothetical protein
LVLETVDLDQHRGIAAQRATDIRRLVQEVAEDRARLAAQQASLEQFMAAAPALSWPEVADKVRYLMTLFLATAEGEDPRRRKLVNDLLSDVDTLLAATNDNHSGDRPAPREGDDNG